MVSPEPNYLSFDYRKKESNQGLKLNLLNANIRSLNAHLEELQAFLLVNDLEPSLIALTETWINNDSNEALFWMEGYHKLVTCNRSWGNVEA